MKLLMMMVIQKGKDTNRMMVKSYILLFPATKVIPSKPRMNHLDQHHLPNRSIRLVGIQARVPKAWNEPPAPKLPAPLRRLRRRQHKIRRSHTQNRTTLTQKHQISPTAVSKVG